ncbi:hypothetical protein B0H12DRAFT_1083446 [Mycena haematopus]|nr:hypothetical protein B0H12DRAFT_1083446 [Mycena haematopus]
MLHATTSNRSLTYSRGSKPHRSPETSVSLSSPLWTRPRSPRSASRRKAARYGLRRAVWGWRFSVDLPHLLAYSSSGTLAKCWGLVAQKVSHCTQTVPRRLLSPRLLRAPILRPLSIPATPYPLLRHCRRLHRPRQQLCSVFFARKPRLRSLARRQRPTRVALRPLLRPTLRPLLSLASAPRRQPIRAALRIVRMQAALHRILAILLLRVLRLQAALTSRHPAVRSAAPALSH